MTATKTIWETKDGRRVRVRDMEDGHLVNTIHLLNRAYERRLLSLAFLIDGPGGPQGDGAQDCAAREMATAEECGPGLEYPTYDALCDEADRRRLTYTRWSGYDL
jgi:hypothetical protein